MGLSPSFAASDGLRVATGTTVSICAIYVFERNLGLMNGYLIIAHMNEAKPSAIMPFTSAVNPKLYEKTKT